MAMRWGKLYKGTPAELSLEDAVAELGVPYRTQFPGYLYGFRFFPDFLLPTLGLVIEVDDASHNKADKIESDRLRTEELGNHGLRVVRCTNDDALSDPRGTVRAMLVSVGMWPLPQKRPRVSSALPNPRRAAQSQRRAARHEERVAARSPDATRPTSDQSPRTDSVPLAA